MHEAEIRMLKAKMILFGVPDHDHDGIAEYIIHGRPTGGFLRAFLSNDLKEALARADERNRYAFFQIANFLWNEAPAVCWGSPERYEGWIEQGGLMPALTHGSANEENVS